MRRLSVFLFCAFAILVADQWSKQAVTVALNQGERIAVFSWLDITLAYNRGAAFGFLANTPWANHIFTLVASAASILILYYLFRNRNAAIFLQQSALSLILAGALGNLADRFKHGYVTDFVSLHYGNWYYPSFNVADAAISIGACFLLADVFWETFRSVRKNR